MQNVLRFHGSSTVPTNVRVPVPSQRIICTQGRIKELFRKIEFSVSPYDTAWLAMVHTPNLPGKPCFPECLNWLLENQFHDGSWSLPSGHDRMVKESMLSTLTSLLALSRWEMGDTHIRKGLEFMQSNFGAVLDIKQQSPTGFEIIFPGLIEHAQDLGLCLPLTEQFTDVMLRKRDSELERVLRHNSKASKAYLAYVSGGLTKSYDWNETMKYQRQNGSLFNSPSCTAALLTHHHDAKCVEYLQSLLQIFPGAVPAVYPRDVYIRLCIVDRLQAMAIDRHFRNEIKDVLDETYRCWLRRDEEVFLDMETCALAYRLLRMNGYKIYSDELAEFEKEDCFFSSEGRNLKEIYSILELYKASKITTPDELVSERLHSWTARYLKQELLDHGMHNEKYYKEVDQALKFTYDAHLDRLETRRSIETYSVEDKGTLETKYRSPNIDNKVFLELAVEDYNFCQRIHQDELEELDKWMTDNRLDKIKFVRHKLTYTHFYIASVLSAPEYSDARMSWTKNIVLTTVIDDLFDAGGCIQELVDLIKLVDKWDDNSDDNYSSERVKIMFLALQNTINELGCIASVQQGRDVTSHMIDLWRTMLNSMMFEYEWGRDKSKVPTVEEYMEHAHNSAGTGTFTLVTLYLVGAKIPNEVVTSPEYNNLCRHMGFCCRLHNDLQTFKREAGQGKWNSVVLCMRNGGLTEEEAVVEITNILDSNKRDLLNIVLDPVLTTVPKVCRDLVWKIVRIAQYVYLKNDGFNSPFELATDLNAVFNRRLEIPSEPSAQGKGMH